MESPFVFGKLAVDDSFIDREEERAYLVSNFNSLISTTIISPRRWGKSSLVATVAKEAMSVNPNLRVAIVDLFNVQSESDFYRKLAEGVIAATSSQMEEFFANAFKFLSSFVPKISFTADPSNEITLSLDVNQTKENPDYILNLAEKIAAEKGVKIMVCIDEFQNIANFSDPEFFQRKLRSAWQTHQNVSYCLYGSKRTMMMEIFTDPSRPFYKFGDIMFLDKIDTPHFTEYIGRCFAKTKKEITPEAIELIIKLADNHPYYTQQLSHLAWYRTSEENPCTEETVNEAFNSLVGQLSLLFANLTDSFTSQQINYLKAFLAGEKSLYTLEKLTKYQISSPTAALRSKKALIARDILDDKAGELSFQDPIYAHWLRKDYFKM